MRTLRALYDEHSGKVSDKWQLYLEAYDEAFAPLRHKAIRMLEIGVQNGGSLEIWTRFFAQATLFVGCDINPDCARLTYTDPRIHMVIGDAGEPDVAQRVLSLATEYDLVIEDGSHTSVDIVRSFARYFPHVADDGLFVVEDMHCSYWMEFGGGLHHPYSSIAFFKHMVDLVNHEHWGIPAARAGLLAGFNATYTVDFTEDLLAQIHSITFLNSLCFIRKRPAAMNVLGRRIVAGSSSAVVSSDLLSGSQAAPPQLENPFSRDVKPAEELVLDLRKRADELAARVDAFETRLDAANTYGAQMSARVAQLEARACEAEAHLRDSRALAGAHELTIAAIHGSRSWRLMAPWRAVGRRLRALASFAKRAIDAAKRLSARISQDRRRGVPVTAVLRRGISTVVARGPGGLVDAMRRYAQNPSAVTVGATGGERDRYEEWIKTTERVSVGEPPASKDLVSVVVPVCNTPPRFLEELFDSLCSQTYPFWELCIHDDASDRHDTTATLRKLETSGRAVHISRGEQRSGIAAATNAALGEANGRWVAFVDHDDLLAPRALQECVRHAVDRSVPVVYTDHDLLNESGRRCHPFFKPDFNRDLLLSQMYIGHLVMAERELVTRVGGLRPEMDGAQDYDLILRFVSSGARIGHVPQILYHWRQHEASTAANANSKPYAHDRGRLALQAFLNRDVPGAVACDGAYTFCYDIRYKAGQNVPRLASIIIPTRDRVDLLDVCVRTLREKTRGVRYEIIVVDNGSTEGATLDWLSEQQAAGNLRVIRADMPFNWSSLNNLAAKEAQGDVLVFLNNDTEFVDGEWLQRLCENALRKEVGCCGPLLTYADGTIQHAGVVVGMGGWADHVFKGLPVAHNQSYFTSPVLRRDVLALTGACMVVSKATFDRLGGFDESFIVCGSDVELCLRAHRAGLLNVYVPEARVIHHESKTRDPRVIPEEDFKRSAQAYDPFRTQGDPCYNVNLDPMSVVPELRVPQ